MNLSKSRDIRRVILFTVALIATRLPFIFQGAGLDGDSWSVVLTAKQLHTTGVYVASRLPGYPVHEFLCALFYPLGIFGLNLLSVVFTVIGVVSFVLVLRHLRFKFPFLAGIALAFVPILYISSTSTIDYTIAFGFSMAAMFLMLRGNLILAGMLLGFGIGTRITTAVMLLPYVILLLEGTDLNLNLKRVSRFVLPAVITAAICLIPVVWKYGAGFFTYYDVPYPTIPKVLYKFSIEVWGLIGFIGLIAAVGLLFLPNRITNRRYLFPRSVNEKYVIAALVAIDIYIIIYLKLPMEAGYLIPILPFVIFIFGKYLHDRAFIFLACMLILSSFVGSITPIERFDAETPSALNYQFTVGGERLNFDILKGPIFAYESRRKNGVDFTNKLIASFDTIHQRSVLVAGRWYNQLLVEVPDTANLKISLSPYMSEEEAVHYYAKGYAIYYLPRQEYYNKVMKNVDLDIYKAMPYIKDARY